MEADSVTGPAKNMIQFARLAAEPADGFPAVEFSFIAYKRDGPNPFATAARDAGVPVDIIAEKGRFDRAVLPQLERVIESRNAQIVQTHNVKSHFLMRWSGIWRRRRWLAFHHGYTWVDTKMRLYNQLDRWSLRAPHHLVAVCGPFRDQLTAFGVSTNRITVQHNSVSPRPAPPQTTLDRLRSRFSLVPGRPVLLIVGRLSSEKGHRDLLHALALLRGRNHPPVHLLVVGVGLEEEPIIQLARDLGLGDWVTLTGLQADVIPFYALADLLVMPSHTEGSPNVLLEAMAQDLPVVATRAGGIPEIAVSGENALLVPIADPPALAQAMEHMLADAGLRGRLASNARSLIERQHTPERYRNSLIRLYLELLARN